MKSKIAYLRGLMEGMQLPDDNNGKLLRAIADCLDAIADEVLVESARNDVIEEQLDLVSDEVDEIEEVLEELLDEEAEGEDDDEDEDEGEEEVCSIDLEDLKELLMNKHGGFCGHHGHHHHGPCHHGHHGHHNGCCEHKHFFDEEDDAEEDWLDEFNYFTCPNCGEIVPLDDEALEQQANPICPKCNSPLFTEGETEKEQE